MNYHKYYSGPDKHLSETFCIQIVGHLLPDDDEVVFTQNLNIRATDPREAYTISGLVRDARLNRLYTKTTITDLYRQSPQMWTDRPEKPELKESLQQDVKAYSVVIVREAGPNPLTGVQSDYAEDHLTIHATSEQEAHHIASFISALPFNGQIKRTIINGSEHFDERY